MRTPSLRSGYALASSRALVAAPEARKIRRSSLSSTLNYREVYEAGRYREAFDAAVQTEGKASGAARTQAALVAGLSAQAINRNEDAEKWLMPLVDDSDPDIDLPQIEHLLQTAEAIRAAGRPRWFILAGLVHDLGKILCLWGEPQWAVVGDTFPVGCRYSERIVFYDAFEANPDKQVAEYQTECGIYQPHCGLDNLLLSWGHDEYLYHVVKDYLPAPALAMIRYHSCYPIHREHAYQPLLKDGDAELLKWVTDFNQYDLYTKRDERMDVEGLRPFYEELIGEYFPEKLAW